MVFKLNSLPKITDSKKRKGKGIGSGLGKTAGRGHKGQKARSGVAINGFEGGQLSIYTRRPHRGFNNSKFAVTYKVITTDSIQKMFESKRLTDSNITKQVLLEKNIIKKGQLVKLVMGKNPIKVDFKIEADKFSKEASKFSLK